MAADEGRRAADAVVQLRRAQLSAAAHVLGIALADDPGYRYMLPDEARRVGELTAMYRLTLADTLRHGTALATVVGEVVTGVLAIYPPGHYPMTATRWVRSALGVGLVAVRTREHSRALVRFARLTAPEVPAGTWYFQALGIRPDLQQGGRGRRLLEAALELADASGAPSYLETSRPRNVPYYERIGYEQVREPMPLAEGGPWIVPMLRPARPQ